MNACVLHAVGDLRFEPMSEPVPRPGWVVVRVAACGVCGSDIPRVFDKGTYRFPTVPGHEFAGTVDALGEGVARELVGHRVAVYPLIPCRACPYCAIGAYGLCTDYDYLGSRRDGAFAEWVEVPAWNLVPVPDGVGLEAAALTEPAAVALHALRRAGVDAGARILVMGLGPIGLLVALWARAMGAGTVLAADIDASKRGFAASLGFTHVYDPRRDGFCHEITAETGDGPDLCVEAAGAESAFAACLEAVRPLGTVVLLGNPAGGMALSQQAYWHILRKELVLLGSWNSSRTAVPRDDWTLVLEAMASGRLDVAPLITHRVGLEGLSDALAMMRDRREFSCKVLCVNP